MSRARENADGARLDAPLASPDFTGTVDLTGTTVSLDDDEISGDKIHGGTISGSPTLVTPALGTVASGNLSNTAIVQPANSVLRVHEFTSQRVNYNTTSDAFVTSGTGTSFTTLANTTSFILNVKGHTMAYEHSGDLPTGNYGLFYHSSATATGETPSGAQIGVNMALGGYSPQSNTGRWDLYLLYHFLEKISCSGSTTYTIQVCGKKDAADYYLNFNNTGTGNIMELSG